MVKLANLRSVFENKRVFITGHSGFKGTWLCAVLNQLGANVKGYSLLPEESKPFFDLFTENPNVEHVFADIRDFNRLKAEVHRFRPDFVFHMAAQPLVIRSYQEPAYTFDVNVMGTTNLMISLRDLPCACSVVVVTTDKVYENIEQDIFYKESDRLGGYDPYSASKACTELVVNSFRSSFFHTSTERNSVSISVARAGNVIGGGDWSQNRVVPDIVRSLIAKKEVVLRNPNAIRPWQHVLEPLTGYLLLAANAANQPPKFSRAFNFGPLPEDHLTVLELANRALERWGHGNIVTKEDSQTNHEAGQLKLDIGLARELLQWHPLLHADEAVNWTIDWYKKEPGLQAEFTKHQIEEYFKK